MINEIVKKNLFIQDNTGDNQGTIWATKNIDPELNRGKIQVAKVMGYRTNTDDKANLEKPAVGFVFFNSTSDKYYAVADDRVWQSATANPNSAWTEVTNTPTDCDEGSDIITFNSKIYVATNNNLKSYVQSGDTWANITGGLSSNPHSMCIFNNGTGDLLYVTDLAEKVYHMTSGETLNKSGSGTLDLNSTTGQNQEITKIAAVTDGIWVATSYTDKAGGEMIKWDGVTENVPTNRYKVPRGVMAMTIKDDRPYILDSMGRLRVFDGTTFKEIDRLPLKDELLAGIQSSNNDRFIHPNGMITFNDEIYCLIGNIRYDSTQDVVENLPAGVWAWNERNGFYHKHSFVETQIPTTNTITDYGANNLAQVGALLQTETSTLSNRTDLLAGISYYADATTTKSAIGIIDTDNDVKKAGYFVTAELQAEQVDEVWQSIVALYDKFKNSTDKIIIKYRTSNPDPVYATGTWSSDSILRSTTDLSNVSNGDEVEILQGKGAGLCSHISSITDTYRIVLDETISGMTGTCKFRTQNWKKIGEINDQTSTSWRKTFDSNASSWIQFKVYMIGTGRSPVLNKLVSVSSINKFYQ